MRSSLKPIGTHPDFPECLVVWNEAADFCHTQPYPTNAQLSEYYQREYREVRQEAPTADYVRFMDHRATEQLKFITETTGRCAFEYALDIGCGAGRLVNAPARTCRCVRGYEADDAMAEFARSQGSGNQVKIINALFNPKDCVAKAEIITMSHVLEHVPAPVEFLASLRENALSSGGFLFVEVPNDPAHWVKKQVEWRLRGLGHLNFFTPESLGKILIHSGLHNAAIRLCGGPLYELIRQRKPRSRIYRTLKQHLSPAPRPYCDTPSYETSPIRGAHLYPSHGTSLVSDLKSDVKVLELQSLPQLAL